MLDLPVGLVMSEDQLGTVTVRIDADLVRRARIVCAHRSGRAGRPLKLVEYLDKLVRSPILADHRAVLSEAAAEDRKEKKSRKGDVGEEG